MKRKKIIRRVLLALVVGLLFMVGNTLYVAGVFKTIKPHFTGTEKSVPILGGAEDITIDQTTGIAYVSADQRRATFQDKKNPVQGTIYWVDLNNPAQAPVNMLPNFKKDFHPHGIYFYRAKSGKQLLFAVNHAEKNTIQSIERFEVQGKKLVHLNTIQHELMTSPNDVVAVGENEFYVTNDHGFTKGFGRTMEEYLRLPLGYVNYYDGKTMKTVSSNITYANGINVSPDGKKLYLASPSTRRVLIFDRKADNSIEKVTSVTIGTAGDNIELDAQGNLWLGCHPQMLKYAAHAKDPKKKSPSQAIKITVKGDNQYEVSEIYLNDGTSLSGSSVAAVYKDNLLVGGVYDRKFLWCKMK
ncbi:MAG TPA: hypothetical protein DCS93_12250 [Microscillaceae bacterium]|nr:hypothetical protein [Microscillaceae bacterium]